MPTVDVVITTGGTGFTGRDVTPEAVKPLFEKEIDGFSTVFHMISFEKVGTSTIQSRACGGLAQGTYIFCLPGSPGRLQGRLERHPRGSSTTATVPAISSRSCRGWRSTGARRGPIVRARGDPHQQAGQTPKLFGQASWAVDHGLMRKPISPSACRISRQRSSRSGGLSQAERHATCVRNLAYLHNREKVVKSGNGLTALGISLATHD